MSCKNPSVCGTTPGDDWGWAVFNANGTGDLQKMFCFHVPGMGGGTGHSSVDIIAWHIADGVFVIHSAPDLRFEAPSPIPTQPGHYTPGSQACSLGNGASGNWFPVLAVPPRWVKGVASLAASPTVRAGGVTAVAVTREAPATVR